MLSSSVRTFRKLSYLRPLFFESRLHLLANRSVLESSLLSSAPLFSISSFHSTSVVKNVNNINANISYPVSDDEPPHTNAYAAIELALDSVVKIFTVSSSPNYFLPWQNKPQRETMGSGFVITGKRILTNAHVVADHTFVLVRKHGSPNKHRAEVHAIGHDCDLAILVVESEEFWEGMNFLELGDIPFLQEAVAVVGYPQGKGLVSEGQEGNIEVVLSFVDGEHGVLAIHVQKEGIVEASYGGQEFNSSELGQEMYMMVVLRGSMESQGADPLTGLAQQGD
ncbi:hypothetical protein HHK36_013386 [Tetracentron sinense]|uniref:Uncharacterized protein n=1 Tax=Tetracentron sinense TaxID=13715 RepID=A0A834ZC54_TETSI|nr:hypothetical protein HHK36_013384 [Tetracentron sinense]KAF8402430.1 hypothetical protein HHK36_013386 [Tetracentron sinense]